MAEGGKSPKDVFVEALPEFLRILGKKPAPFTILINSLTAKGLITDDEGRAIREVSTSVERGDAIAEKLKDRIRESDDPVACLLTICDVFESDTVNHSPLKKHGANMRKSISNQSSQTLEVNEDHLQQPRRELIDQSRQTLEVNEDHPQQPMCQDVLEMEKKLKLLNN